MFVRSLLQSHLAVAGNSCRGLARQMGVTHTVLWRFIKGRSVSSDNYSKILRFIFS